MTNRVAVRIVDGVDGAAKQTSFAVRAPNRP
jgi:hypothetical protein